MISIVIPLYNKASTIERALNAVISQTFQNWEVIVVDDGSQDNGGEIVTRYNDSRVHLYRQENSGVSAARNFGVTLAKNDIVTFLDADDYWDKEHLSNINQVIKRFPDSQFYATAYFMVNDEGDARKIHLRKTNEELIEITDYFLEAVEKDHPVHSSAVAMTKSVFKAVGGFPVGISAGEDIITWARLACIDRLAYSKKPTSYYVLPPYGESRGKTDIRRPQFPDFVGGELHVLFLEYKFSQPNLSRYIGAWHRIRAMIFMELNEKKFSITELFKAISISGLKIRDIASLGLLILPPKCRANALVVWRKNKPF